MALPECLHYVCPMKESSLARRYAFKLMANLAAVPVYLVMEALLPRALGPATYGNFNFVTAQFQQAAAFLDMGSSTCLCMTLSKRPGEAGLLAFYLRVSILVFALTMLSGLLCLYPPAGAVILPGVPLWLAPLGALWAYLTWTGRILRGMNDAMGITVSSEVVRMSFSMLGAVVLLCLFFSGLLSLGVLFAQQYFFLFLPAVGYAWVMRRAWNLDHGPDSAPEHDAANSPAAPAPGSRDNEKGGIDNARAEKKTQPLTLDTLFRLEPKAKRAYIKEFTHYSGPLFVLALGSALTLGGERWLLQIFAGSEAQGYFSLGQKVGMACFLFVSAMTPLFMRELSKAHGKNDYAGMGLLMDRYAPMLYSVAALLSAFACVEGDFLTRLFGGEKFLAAGPAVRIMALYPLHQAYGQLAGSVFHASAETRALRNVSLIFMAFGLIVSYFMLAPADSSLVGGLGLGAVGLAVKSVGVQVISVCALLWVCSRRIHFKLGRNLLHQIFSLGGFLLLSLAARELGELLLSGEGEHWQRFIFSGVLYGMGCLLAVIICPWLAGLKREDLLFIATKLNLKKT